MTTTGNNIDICENAINRIDKLINSFNLSNIHPNTVCIFYYQAAITYAMNQKDEKALTRLKMYIDNSYNFIKNKTKCIYSDDFFDSLDKIYEESDFGTNLPRSKKFIYETALHSLEHPAFASICENDDFKEMKKNVLNKWRDIYEQH